MGRCATPWACARRTAGGDLRHAASDVEEWCRELGADIYLEKSAGASEIAAALRAMLQSDSELDELDDAGEFKPDTKLSKRQKQLLVMLDEGLSNRDIAERWASASTRSRCTCGACSSAWASRAGRRRFTMRG
jgi:FixJ family two-component response regulator